MNTGLLDKIEETPVSPLLKIASGKILAITLKYTWI
jgi:hypothetical protein